MDELGFDGKVAIVTGSGNGLGRAHALELARRGARVVVNDVGGSVTGTGTDDGPAQRVVDEITALGGEAVSSRDSVATSSGAHGIVHTALEAFGRIDIVVNNAGILRDSSFAKLTDDDMDSVIAVHLMGTYHVTKAAWPALREAGGGSVINTTSSSGLIGNFGQSNYGAAKMGVVGLTRVLAIEGQRSGIRVNAIAPAARTRMTEELLGPMVGASLAPELVSPLVAWLAHPTCPTTGHVYSAGGGTIARFFVGLTEGVHWSQPTAESIRDSWQQIGDRTTYIEPFTQLDEFEKLARHLGAG